MQSGSWLRPHVLAVHENAGAPWTELGFEVTLARLGGGGQGVFERPGLFGIAKRPPRFWLGPVLVQWLRAVASHTTEHS